MEKGTRRQVLRGMISGVALMTGCLRASELPFAREATNSASHAGMTVTVESYDMSPERLARKHGERCIKSIEEQGDPARMFLSIRLAIESTGTAGDVDWNAVAESARLRCENEGFGPVSTQFVPTASNHSELSVTFKLREEIDPEACEVRLSWGGQTSRFSLGREVERTASTNVPRCSVVSATTASFKARLVTARGANRPLFGPDDIATVGDVERSDETYSLPLHFSEGGANNLRIRLRRAHAATNPNSVEIVFLLEGTEVKRTVFGRKRANTILEGEWDRRLVVTCSDAETAARVRAALTGEPQPVRNRTPRSPE